MKSGQRGFSHGGEISDDEMYDANEREMSKEVQNFRKFEKTQNAKPTPENTENSVGEAKNVNIFGVVCVVLSVLCLAMAVAAMVYFVGG